MRKYFIYLVFLISAIVQAQTPIWFKVAVEGDRITNTIPINMRFGSGACWSKIFNNVLLTNFSASLNGFGTTFKIIDPCPTVAKEIDVQEGSTIQSIVVNGMVVIVPALVAVIPPPPIPTVPTITLQLTVNPVPVVLNNTKYSCTSVVLDNTGTLTLTCP